MNAQEIWDAICSLAQSQGFYGRLKRSIEESGNKDEVLAQLESKHFADKVDMVLYFES